MCICVGGALFCLCLYMCKFKRPPLVCACVRACERASERVCMRAHVCACGLAYVTEAMCVLQAWRSTRLTGRRTADWAPRSPLTNTASCCSQAACRHPVIRQAAPPHSNTPYSPNREDHAIVELYDVMVLCMILIKGGGLARI